MKSQRVGHNSATEHAHEVIKKSFQSTDYAKTTYIHVYKSKLKPLLRMGMAS